MRDHLLDWWRVRAEVDWSGAAWHTPPVRGARDGFLDVIRAGVTRDPARAARLEAAYALATADADAGLPLTVDRLTAWQRVVLGDPDVGLRTGPAYAKGGRERYGLAPGTWARFARCLEETADPRVPLPARAARAHLDVCFVHPFPDGNGRAALLTTAVVLRREGVVPDLAAPAVTVPRRADDASGAADLARLLAVLADATRRRAARTLAGTAHPGRWEAVMTQAADGPTPVAGHDEARHRYVLRVGDEQVGVLTYRVEDDRVVLEHTVVDTDRQEKGLGSRLVRFALDDVRASGRRVVPQCPFVRAYVEQHPGYADLVA